MERRPQRRGLPSGRCVSAVALDRHASAEAGAEQRLPAHVRQHRHLRRHVSRPDTVGIGTRERALSTGALSLWTFRAWARFVFLARFSHEFLAEDGLWSVNPRFRLPPEVHVMLGDN